MQLWEPTKHVFLYPIHQNTLHSLDGTCKLQEALITTKYSDPMYSIYTSMKEKDVGLTIVQAKPAVGFQK